MTILKSLKDYSPHVTTIVAVSSDKWDNADLEDDDARQVIVVGGIQLVLDRHVDASDMSDFG